MRHPWTLLPLAVLLAGCANLPPIGDTTTPTTSDAGTADAAGLTPYRHTECNIGPAIIRYLETGDNQGNPKLDQILAQYVHLLGAPQERSMADWYIQQCDQQADGQQFATRQNEARAQQQAQQQAAQNWRDSERLRTETAQCDKAGGRFQGERCYSTVDGDPSGRPGATCNPGGHPVFVAYQNGDIQPSLSTTGQFYPGCFTQ